MIVQELRLKEGWSQQQLADISGLNVRTIQRIEKGQPASLASYLLVLAGLAAINLWFSPKHLWFLYVAASWGLVLAIQGLRAFGLITWFDTDWGISQVEKRLGRKLSDEEIPGPERRERPTMR